MRNPGKSGSTRNAVTPRAGGRIGLREDDVDARDAAIGYPGFCAIEDVMITLARGAGLDSGGVRAGLRLGEAEGAENFAAREAR